MYFQNYLQLLETYTMIMISLFPSTKKNLLFPEVYNDFNSVNINSYLIIFIDLYLMDFHFYMLKISFVDRVGFFFITLVCCLLQFKYVLNFGLPSSPTPEYYPQKC